MTSPTSRVAQVAQVANEDDSGHRCGVEEEHTERQSPMHFLPVF